MTTARTFGGWLREQRQQRGVTQDALADRLGFSTGMLRKLESGARRPSGPSATLLATYFHIPTDEQTAFVAFARSDPAAAPGAGDPAQPPWRSGYRRQTNLPARLTQLIGREQDRAAVGALLLHPHTRLVTLTGPPGIGKTHLAMEVARDLIDHFADGVFFVDLAPVTDPDLALSAVARALRLTESGPRPREAALLDYVAGRRMLLLLDNFEQILDAAGAVVQLLEAGPWLKVLVTSREALHVRGERARPTPPLGLPALRPLPDVASLLGYPAVALFVARAQVGATEFSLTAENAAAVAAVCVGLEGLPLALELAAARVRHLSPAALQRALHSRLALLTGGGRDLPARQRTLRAAISWSYDLLDTEEQTLFRRLAVFTGGGTLTAMAAVCSAADRLAIRAQLDSLLDKNLLRRRPGARGEPRFGMLELIREFALEQLVAAGERPRLEQRHAAYFLALAEQAAPELWGPQQAAWLDRLERDHDNLRAGLAWAAAHDPAAALRGATALSRFWGIRGYFTEGRARMAAALAGAAPLDPAAVGRDWARAFYAAGSLALNQDDFPAAEGLLEQSLQLSRQCGDGQTTTRALRALGIVTDGKGDVAAARDLFAQSLALSREVVYPLGVGLALWELGNMALAEADYAGARTLFAESLTEFRALGDARNIAGALGGLGRLAGHEGDYPAARALLEESQALYRELNDKAFMADTALALGYVAQSSGDYAQALSYSEQGLALHQEVGRRHGVWGALFQMGCNACAAGDYDSAGAYFRAALIWAQELQDPARMGQALAGLGGAAVGQGRSGGAAYGARLLGAAAAAPARTGGDGTAATSPRDPAQWVAAARAALGDAAFATAFAAGQALPLATAIALAMAPETTEPPAAPARGEAPAV
jgi:predicted ATPase/transcriptional regulator with XRE-family HTH domain